MRKGISDFSLRAAAVIVITGCVIAFMLAAASRVPAADLSNGGVIYDDGPVAAHYVCGQPVDDIVLFDEWGRPTIPARTPMYTCITGTTLAPHIIPPSPEYCCH